MLSFSAALTQHVDRDFIQKAASGGMAEIQVAQLAQQRANSPQVKEFANRVIADHTQANNELRQIAQQRTSRCRPSQPKEAAAERS